MRRGWQSGFATITVTILTLVLVVFDVTDGTIRSWLAAHPFTTATMAGILVLGGDGWHLPGGDRAVQFGDV